MPPKSKKKPPLVWKRGEDYIIFNPPRRSEQRDEWIKVKEKYEDDRSKDK